MSMTRKKFLSVFATAIAAFAMTLAIAPAAFAATPDDPEYSLSTYSTGNMDQHVVLTVDYGETVAIADNANVMSGDFTIEIAGYNIVTSDSYKRPVTATADGTKLVLDIGNCVDASDNAAFTAQYGGVISVIGAPAGVTAGGAAVDALDIYTVIPTGVHVSMTNGAGTNNVSATVDHAANVRGMVHVALYNKGADGKYTPVNSSATAGNLQVGTYTTHAHAFTTLTTADYAANIAAFDLPEGYSITANGSDLTVTGPEGSQLYLYIFDDTMLQSLGLTFNGVVSSEGILNPDGTPVQP